MNEHNISYRLGLDLGTNSIGWCMLRLNNNVEPVAVIKAGVRIFHNGRKEKTDEPLAVERRNARSARRNLDRKISRRKHLLISLVKYGLLPANESERKALSILNPYELRNRAVNEKIEVHELGRILMHLSKRRGFKSNRKVDKADDSGKIKPAIERLKKKMEEQGKKTVGEYFYYLILNGKSVRARLGKVDGKEGYEIYLDRALMEEEYNIIMAEQQKYRKELTDDVIKELFHIIFYQRPLKKQVIGKCSLTGEDTKLHKAHVLAQDFILLQKINDLRVYDENLYEYRELTPNEKSVLKAELQNKIELTFNKIRTLLKKSFSNVTYGQFSHEAIDDKIAGNKTNAIMLHKDVLGDKWDNFSDDDKFNIIDMLFSNESNDEVKEKYRNNFNLSDEEINNILDKAIYKLDTGYLRYGKKAVLQLNEKMDKENMGLTKAIIHSGLSRQENNEVSEYLEYYGKILQDSVVDPQINNPKNDEERYGKISNPTVHIALNQLRKLVNELIFLYGKPEQIVIELARDLKNGKAAKLRHIKQNKENQKINDKIRQMLEEFKVKNDKTARDKVKLWFELGNDESIKRCVYTGKIISLAELFTDNVQIEHIVPYSRSLDDSFNNKTLSMKSANYYKGNKTPYEAFSSNKDGFNYDEILERAKVFNKSKFDRFTKDAMNIYNKEGGDFIASQLSDTQYISRMALEYLKSIYPKNKHSSIWSIPGQLTAMIRGRLGLNDVLSDNNEKNRNDHRHHAVDAFVVAITTRSFLQKISSAANDMEELYNMNKYANRKRILDKMPEPFTNYRKSLELAVNNIKTSHKADRSITGMLHEKTAYSIVNSEGKNNVAVRWSIDKFKEKKHFESIRDYELRNYACNNNGKFMEIVDNRGIRNIRVLKSENPLITIQDKFGKTYKAFAGGDNLCVEIYEVDGVKHAEVIQLFDAAQQNFIPKWMKKNPTGKLLMRLFKGDIIGFVDKDKGVDRIYCTVQQIRQKKSGELKELGLININGHGTDEQSQRFIVFNTLFNKYQAKQFNISVSGIISKKKTADINFWKNRK